jgi:hypothetical protein
MRDPFEPGRPSLDLEDREGGVSPISVTLRRIAVAAVVIQSLNVALGLWAMYDRLLRILSSPRHRGGRKGRICLYDEAEPRSRREPTG